eukprot:COSAG05_NODE_44_length_25563_cov_118.074419_3_plen_130_part_00
MARTVSHKSLLISATAMVLLIKQPGIYVRWEFNGPGPSYCMVQLSPATARPLHAGVQSGLRDVASTATATSGDQTSLRSPSERGETSPASPPSTARASASASAHFVSASTLMENATRGAKRRREDGDQE